MPFAPAARIRCLLRHPVAVFSVSCAGLAVQKFALSEAAVLHFGVFAGHRDGNSGALQTAGIPLLCRAPRAGPSQRCQHMRGPSHHAVFAVQIRQAHGVDLCSRPELAGPVVSCEGEAAVFDQERMEPQVPGHADSGFHGIIRDHPGDDQHSLARRAQPGFEAGSNEGAVGPLGDHDFTALYRKYRWFPRSFTLTMSSQGAASGRNSTPAISPGRSGDMFRPAS